MIRIAYVTPYPFFFITLAIPYLLVAVSMGYTRQSVAIGLFMWGICLLLKKNNLSYFFLILFGSFFHKSAALLFFFLFVNIPLNFTKLFLYSFFFIILILFFVIPRIDIVLQHFLIVEYATSAGVFHRLFLNLFAAIIFLITYKKWEINNSEKRLYTMFVIFTFILLVSAFFNSIIVDRIAIYLIPIQLLILTNATNLINNNFIKNIYILSLLYFYFLVLYIWLNLGHYSIYWVPYRNYLF